MKKLLCVIILFISIYANAQDNSTSTGTCVSGNCKNGNGTYHFNNGDKYVGDFVNELLHGYGVYTYADGSTYKGQWKNHKQEDPNGEYISKTFIYKGSFKNGSFEGIGTQTFLTGARAGDKYVGDFKNGKREGKGTYSYSTNNSTKVRYEGTFGGGKFNGEGILYYKDGNTDDGLWKDDVFIGTKIGTYNRQDVLKKGDTIITMSNNNRYLLSQQTISGEDSFITELNESIKKGTFIIEKDLQGKISTIGYITHSGKIDVRGKALSIVDCRFFEKKEKEQIGTYQNTPVYKLSNNNNIEILIGYDKYILSDQERGNIVDNYNKNDFIIAKRNVDRAFDVANIVGVVKVVDNKYQFIQINTKYLGTYNGQKVVYFDNIGIVAIESIDNTYLLDWQIQQSNCNNEFIRKYLVHKGKIKPSANYVYNGHNLIGWVDIYASGEINYTKNTSQKATGLNLFGSFYIGPNNPKAMGKDNFDLIPQDFVDKSALNHDNCYMKFGAVGFNGMCCNFDVRDCDERLALGCFTALLPNFSQIGEDKNLLEIAIKSNPAIQSLLTASDITATINSVLSSFQNPLKWGENAANFLCTLNIPRETEEARALMTGLLFAKIAEYKKKIKGENINPALTNIVEIIYEYYYTPSIRKKETEVITTSNQTITTTSKQAIKFDKPTMIITTSGDSYNAPAGSYFEGTMKDGKVVVGKLYDKEGGTAIRNFIPTQ